MESLSGSSHFPPNPSSAPCCRKIVFAVISLAIIIFSIYGNTFDCSWHFDDETNIINNSSLHLKQLSWKDIRQTLFSDRNHPTIFYRPIACVSFALNYYFGGLDVFGYHLVNIFIHLLASIFLFLFVYNTLNLPLLRDRYSSHAYFIALLSTVLWAINPIQIQAITYIVQRMTSLGGMFYIMSMYFHLKARTTETKPKKMSFFILSLFTFIMALGSKENAVMLPLSILLFEFLLLQETFKDHMKKNLRLLLMIVLGILLLGFFYTHFNNENIFSLMLDGYQERPFTLAQRLFTEPRAIIFYISLLFYPVPTRLNIAHDITLSNGLFDPLSTIISIFLILGVVILAFYFAKKRPLITFCVLFFFLNHVIESTLLPLELIFEHRNYIPSMFLFVPCAMGIRYLFNYYAAKRAMQYILFSFIVLLLIGLGHSTFVRNFAWKNDKTLWGDASEKAPDLYRPHHNLGKYYHDHGYIEEAILEYKKALEKPFSTRKNEYFITYYNLGKLFAGLNDYQKALSFYHRASALNPDFAPTYNNIASIMDREGRYELANKYLIKALKLDPDGVETNFNLGMYYLKDRQPDKAISHFDKVANINRLRERVLLYLGIANKQKGYLGKAAIYCENALKENPRNISPRLHMAEIYYMAGDHKRAKEQAEQLIGLLKGKDAFKKILHDLLKEDRSSELLPSATILIPLMREASLAKSETLKEWGELLQEKDLRLKGKK